ncbi:MAG: endonuclease V [Ignisphaera sp.]
MVGLFSAEVARRLQSRLSMIVLEELDDFPSLDLETIRFIAGFDSSYAGNIQCAVVVVYDLQAGRVVEKTHVGVSVKVPYIPGLLAFREIPGYMRAYGKLSVKPDVLMIDEHGLAHPRAFGIATHLGLILNKPSIGVAKKHLHSEIVTVDNRKIVKAHGRIIGEVIEHEKQKIYVSIGYKIKLEDAVKIVKKLLVENKKLPIPLQIADEYSKTIKNKYYK